MTRQLKFTILFTTLLFGGMLVSTHPAHAVTITLNSVTISSPTVRPDNITQYVITVVATDTIGANRIIHEYAQVNQGGANAGQWRGYVTWSRDDDWPTFKDHRFCTGQGAAVINPNNGDDTHIGLDACTSAISGNTRTITFTVHFKPTFTTPLTNNDISGWAKNNNGGNTGWVNFDINFALAQNPACVSATPDGDTAYINGSMRRTYVNGATLTTNVSFGFYGPNGAVPIWVWAVDAGNGSWYYDINPNSFATGQVVVEAYVHNASYSNVFCDYANFTVAPPTNPTCASATPDGDWWASGTSGIRRTYANGVANATTVSFGFFGPNGVPPIWVWATDAGLGTWYFDVDPSGFAPGLVTVVSYMQNPSYGDTYCDSANLVMKSTGTININANIPTSWTLTCALVNPTCPTYSSGANQTSGSYPSLPTDTWTLVPGDIPGYDATVTPNSSQSGP